MAAPILTALVQGCSYFHTGDFKGAVADTDLS